MALDSTPRPFGGLDGQIASYATSTGIMPALASYASVAALPTASGCAGALARVGGVLFVSDGTKWNAKGGAYWFVGANDGTTDEYAALQTALTTYKHVIIPPNTTVAVSRQVEVPDDGSLIGHGKHSVIKALNSISLQADGTWPMGDVGESGQARCMVRARQRAQVKNLTFDGNDFRAGGVMVWFNDDVVIEDVWVTDAVESTGPNANTATGATSAVNLNQADRITIRRLHVSRARFGAQIWMCNDVQIHDSYHDIGYAGFWTSDSNRVRFINCHVSNQEDVGLDWEGGSDCVADGGSVRACKNGELAFFQGISASVANGLKFRNIEVRREATYTHFDGTDKACGTNFGAVFFSSLAGASKDCGVENCEFWIDYDRAFSTPEWTAGTATTSDITWFFRRNTIHHRTTGPLFRVNGTCRGASVHDNEWDITAVPGSSAEWKNAGRSYFGRNIFRVASDITLTTALVHFYEDQGSNANINSRVVRNEFHNASKYAAKVTGQPRNWILQENIFSTRAEEWGGLEIASNSAPIFVNQRLHVKPATKATAGTSEVLDFANTTDFANLFTYTSTTFGVGADITMEATIGTTVVNAYGMTMYQNPTNYLLKVADDGGVGSGTGRSGSTSLFLASVSGATATWTKTTDATVQFRARILLNSLAQ